MTSVIETEINAERIVARLTKTVQKLDEWGFKASVRGDNGTARNYHEARRQLLETLRKEFGIQLRGENLGKYRT